MKVLFRLDSFITTVQSNRHVCVLLSLAADKLAVNSAANWRRAEITLSRRQVGVSTEQSALFPAKRRRGTKHGLVNKARVRKLRQAAMRNACWPGDEDERADIWAQMKIRFVKV